MENTRASINGTITRCKAVFDNIIDLLENGNATVCGHSSFGSSGKHVSSLLKALKADYKSASSSNGSTYQVNKLVERHLKQYVLHCNRDGGNQQQKPCFECAKRFCCEIFHVYADNADFRASRQTQTTLFTTSTEFQWIGLCSLYCSIGRYYYRNTNIFRIIFAHYTSFCKQLNRNLFDIDTGRIHPFSELLPFLNLFSLSIVANVYRIKEERWIEMFLCQNFISTLLDIIYNHCELTWNVFFSTMNTSVVGKLCTNMHALFIILTITVHFARKQYRQNLPKIVTAIPHYTCKFGCLLDSMKSDDFFAWFITSVVLVLTGDDNGSRRCQKYDWKHNHRTLCSKYCIDPQRLYGHYGL
eukprot:529983_1